MTRNPAFAEFYLGCALGYAMRYAVAAAFLFELAGCSRGDPPAPDVSPSVALPELAGLPNARAESAWTSPTADGPAPSDADAEADREHLPQTRDMPSSSSPALAQRAAALWEAIVRDEPERAMPFFFPLGAYEQVKDVADPSADWKHRLVAAYARDIHALHAQLGEAGSARFVSLDVPSARARWVEPAEEWNKLGYFRVFGSKLRYEANGDSRAFDVKSLISWRGEWYVVHLNAIK